MYKLIIYKYIKNVCINVHKCGNAQFIKYRMMPKRKDWIKWDCVVCFIITFRSKCTVLRLHIGNSHPLLFLLLLSQNTQTHAAIYTLEFKVPVGRSQCCVHGPSRAPATIASPKVMDEVSAVSKHAAVSFLSARSSPQQQTHPWICEGIQPGEEKESIGRLVFLLSFKKGCFPAREHHSSWPDWS